MNQDLDRQYDLSGTGGVAGRRALAVVSQYSNKYYWEESLGRLPEEIRKEVLVLLITITEESGGMTALGFEQDGEVYIASTCEEGDLGYDGISAGLLIHEIEHEHADLLSQLSDWYRQMHPEWIIPYDNE